MEIAFVFKCLYNQLLIGKIGEKYGVYVIDYGIRNRELVLDIIKKREDGNSYVCLIINESRVEPHGDNSLFDKAFQYLVENDQEWTTLTFFETESNRVRQVHQGN